MSTNSKYLNKINFSYLKSLQEEAFEFKKKKYLLFRQLGIPSDLKNISILEFGVGSGNSAEIICRNSLPKEYYMVDSYKGSIDLCKKKFNKKNFKFFKTTIKNFMTSKKFDIVILEGVLPGLEYPENNLKYAKKFVKKNGILIVTTTSPASFVSDALRRALKPTLENNSIKKNFHRKILVKTLKNHFKNLPGRARNLENWIQDTIENPMKRIMFTFDDCLSVLGNDFRFFQSNPNYSINHTWFKQINTKKNIEYNKRILNMYKNMSLSFLNFKNDEIKSLQILKTNQHKIIDKISMEIYKNHIKFWFQSSDKNLKKILNSVDRLSKILKNVDKQSSIALKDYAKGIRRFNSNSKIIKLGNFEKFFSRGMHYLSFLKI